MATKFFKIKNYHYLFYLILLCLFSNCKKEAKLPPKGALLLSEEYYSIIEKCRANTISDSVAIRANLIGEWKLIAFRCGGCLAEPVEILDWGIGPDVTLELTQDKGTLDFKYNETETLLAFDWDLKPTDQRWDTLSTFYLSVEPAHKALKMYIYCDKYIYFNYAPVDGHLYLYEKQ